MNAAIRSQSGIINALIFLLLFSLCVAAAFALATLNVYWAAGIVLGMAFFAVGFLSPRLSLFILMFSMLLSPEFGSRDVSGQGFTIRFEDLLILVMGFAWLAKSAVHKEIGLAIYTKLNRPILIYIVVCFISTLLGIIRGTVASPITGIMFVLKYFEYFVIFFLTINNVSSKQHLKSLLGTMFAVYIIVVLIGFSQIPSGNRISAPFEGETGEPNTLGGYLIIMMSLNLALFLYTENIRYRILAGISAFMGFIALLYTLSRASWLGFAMMYIVLIMLSTKKTVLIVAILIGILIAPFVLPDVVVDRFLYTFQKDRKIGALSHYSLSELEYMYHTGDVSYDSSTMARLNSMKQSLKDFQKKPMLGYGVTGYEFLDAQFHRVLIETGMIGFISYLYLLFITGKSLYKVHKDYRKVPLYRIVSLGSIAAFIGLLFHSIGSNTFIIVRIMEPFWCLVGLNLSIITIEKSDS